VELVERGYTLLELLITLALLVIVAAFAVPSFQDSIARNARESAMLDLMSSLALARSEAVSADRPVSICRSTNLTTCAGSAGDWSGGWLVFSDTGTAGSIGGSDTVVQVHPVLSIGGAVTVKTSANAAVTGEYLRFDGNGFLTHPSGGAYFKFCTDDGAAANARAVWVANTGRASLSVDDGDGIHNTPAGGNLSCP